MSKKSILHMFDPMPHNSPFDVNMAVDAGFDIIMPYNNVNFEDTQRLVQDAIFSRGPKGVKQTAIFIGGRDMSLAYDMLTASKRAMVPPFEVSVLADPSGAFTTAAALVACVEKALADTTAKTMADCNVVVFGGTGPVGIASGVIASLTGANTTLVDHLNIHTAEDTASEYNRLFNCQLQGAVAGSPDEKSALIAEADIILCAAKAGVQVINQALLSTATHLKVAGDVNAVPPAGIEGIKLKDFGRLLNDETAVVGVGPLAIGDIKYKTQQRLLQQLLTTEKPVYLDFRDAFAVARSLVNPQA
jgi:methylene-tetrahydromethanopterin dehydrogenase